MSNVLGNCVVCGRRCIWRHEPTGRIAHPKCVAAQREKVEQVAQLTPEQLRNINALEEYMDGGRLGPMLRW